MLCIRMNEWMNERTKGLESNAVYLCILDFVFRINYCIFHLDICLFNIQQISINMRVYSTNWFNILHWGEKILDSIHERAVLAKACDTFAFVLYGRPISFWTVYAYFNYFFGDGSLFITNFASVEARITKMQAQNNRFK